MMYDYVREAAKAAIYYCLRFAGSEEEASRWILLSKFRPKGDRIISGPEVVFEKDGSRQATLVYEHGGDWRDLVVRISADKVGGNLFGLTPIEAEERWLNKLSVDGQQMLVTEAGLDVGLKGGSEPFRVSPDGLGHCCRGVSYGRMLSITGSDLYPGLQNEIHRRLAGKARPED